MEDLNQNIRWGQSRPAQAQTPNNANKYKSKLLIKIPPCELPNSSYKPGGLKRSASFSNLYMETPKPRNRRSRSVSRDSDYNKDIERVYNSDFEVNYDSDCSEPQYLTPRQTRKSGRRRCNTPSPDKQTTDDELEKLVNTPRGRSRQRGAKFSGHVSENEQSKSSPSQRYSKRFGKQGTPSVHDRKVSSNSEHLKIKSSPIVSKPGIKIRIKSGRQVSFVEPNHIVNSPAVTYDSGSDKYDSNYHPPRRRSRRKGGGQSDLEASDLESDYESDAEDWSRKKSRHRKVQSDIEDSEPEDTVPQYLPIVTVECEFCEDVFQCEEDLEDHCLKHFSSYKNLNTYLNSRRLGTKPDERVELVLKEHHETHQSKSKKKVNFEIDTAVSCCIVDLKSRTTESESDNDQDLDVGYPDDVETSGFDRTVIPPESKTDFDIEVNGRKIYVTNDSKLAVDCSEKTLRIVLSALRSNLKGSISASTSPSRKSKTSGTHTQIKEPDSDNEAETGYSEIGSDDKNTPSISSLPSSSRIANKSRKLSIENREKDLKSSHDGISEQYGTDCVNSPSLESRAKNKTRKVSHKRKDQDQKSDTNAACILQTVESREESKARRASPENKKQNLKLNAQAACGIEKESDDNPISQLSPTKGSERKKRKHSSQLHQEIEEKTEAGITDEIEVESKKNISPCSSSKSRHKKKSLDHKLLSKSEKVEDRSDKSNFTELSPLTNAISESLERDVKLNEKKLDICDNTEARDQTNVAEILSPQKRTKNKSRDHRSEAPTQKANEEKHEKISEIDSSDRNENDVILSPQKGTKNKSRKQSSEAQTKKAKEETDKNISEISSDRNENDVILSPQKRTKKKSRDHSSESKTHKTNEEIYEKISEIDSDISENDIILSPKKQTKKKSRDHSSEAQNQKTNEEIHENKSEIYSDRNENNVILSSKKQTKNKSRKQISEAKSQKTDKEIYEKISEIDSDINENDMILSPKKRTKTKSRDHSSEAQTQKTNEEIHENKSEIDSDRNENNVILSPQKQTKNTSRKQISEAKSQKTDKEIYEKISEIDSDINENDIILSPKKRTKTKLRDHSSEAQTQKTNEEIHENISQIDSEKNENDAILSPQKQTKNKSRKQSSEAQTQKTKEEIHEKRSDIDFDENVNDVLITQSGNQLKRSKHLDIGKNEHVLEPDEGDSITSESSKFGETIDNTDIVSVPTSQKTKRKKNDSDLHVNKQQTVKNVSDSKSSTKRKISIDKTTAAVFSPRIKTSSKQVKQNQSSNIESHNQSLKMNELESGCVSKGLNTTEQTKSRLEKKLMTKQEKSIAALKLKRDKLNKSLENLKFVGRETNDQLLVDEDANQKISTARSKSVESKKDKHSKTQTRSKSAETRNQQREDTSKVGNKQLKELKEDLVGWSKAFERMRMLTADLCQSDIFSSLGPMENRIIPRWQTSRKGKSDYVSRKKAKRKSDHVLKKAQTNQEYEAEQSPFELKLKTKKEGGRTTEHVSNKTLDKSENRPFDKNVVTKIKLAGTENEKQLEKTLAPEGTPSLVMTETTISAKVNLLSPRRGYKRGNKLPLSKELISSSDDSDSDTKTLNVSKKTLGKKCAERTDETDGCAVAGNNRTIDLSDKTLDTKCAEMTDETDGCAVESDRISSQQQTKNVHEESTSLKSINRKNEVQDKLIKISKSVLRHDSPLKHYDGPSITDQNNVVINQGYIEANTDIDQSTDVNQGNNDLERIEKQPEFVKDMSSKIKDKSVHSVELEEISDDVLDRIFEESEDYCTLDSNNSVTTSDFCEESFETNGKKSDENKSENTPTDELFILVKHMADKNKSGEENLNTFDERRKSIDNTEPDPMFKILKLTELSETQWENQNAVTELTAAEKEDKSKKRGKEHPKQNRENNKTEKMNSDFNEEKSKSLSSEFTEDSCKKPVKCEKRKILSESENPSKVRKLGSADYSEIKNRLQAKSIIEISKTKMSAAHDEHAVTNSGNRWLRCSQCNKLCHTQWGLDKHQQEHESCIAQNSDFLNGPTVPSVKNSESIAAVSQVNTGKADIMNIVFLSCNSSHDTGNSKQKHFPMISQMLSNPVSPCKSGSSKSDSDNKSILETNVEITSKDVKIEKNLSNNVKSKTEVSLRKKMHKSKVIDEKAGKVNEGVESTDKMQSRDTDGLAENIVNSETIDNPTEDVADSEQIVKGPSSDTEPIKIKISLKQNKADENVKKNSKAKPKPSSESRKIKMVLSKVKLGNFESKQYVCKFNGTPEKPNWTVNKNDTQQSETETTLSDRTTEERSVKYLEEKDLAKEQKNELKTDGISEKSDKYNDKDSETSLSLDSNCNNAHNSGKVSSNTEKVQVKELVNKQEKYHDKVKNADSSKTDKRKISRTKDKTSEKVKLKDKAKKDTAENLTDFEKALVGKEERKKPEKSAAKKLKKEVKKNESVSNESNDKQDQNDLPPRNRKSSVLEEAHHFKRSKMAQNIFSKRQKRDLDDGLPDFTSASVTLNDLPPLFVSSKSPTKTVNSRNEKCLSSPKGISSKLTSENDNGGGEIGASTITKELKKQLEAAGIGRSNSSLKLKDLMKLNTSGSVFSQTWNKQKGDTNVLSSHSQPVLPSFSDVFLADSKVKETSFSGFSRFTNNHFDMSFSDSLGTDNVNETSFGSQSSSLFKFDSGLGNENTLNHTALSALNHSATSTLNHSASSAFQTVDELDSIRKSVESGLSSLRRKTEKMQSIPQILRPNKASPGCVASLNRENVQNFSSTPAFKSATLSQSSRVVKSDLNLSLISHASETSVGEPKPKRPRIKRYIVSEVDEKQDNKYTKDFKELDSTTLPGTSSAGNSTLVQSQPSTNTENLAQSEVVSITSCADVDSDKNNVCESRLRIISGDSDGCTTIGGRISAKTVDDTTLLDYEFDQTLDGLSDHDSYDQSLMEHSADTVKEDKNIQDARKHIHDASNHIQDVHSNSNSKADFEHGNFISKINAKPVKESRIIYERDSEQTNTEEFEEFETEVKQVEENNSPALDVDLEEESGDLVIDVPNVKDLPKEFNFTVKVGVDQERVVKVDNESQRSESQEKLDVWVDKVKDSDSDIEEIDLMASQPSGSSKTYDKRNEENNNLMPSGKSLKIKDTLEISDDVEDKVKEASEKDDVSNAWINDELAPEEIGRSEITSLSYQELMDTDSQFSFKSKSLENRKSIAASVSPSNELEDVLDIFASDDEASFLEEDSEDLPSEQMGSSSRPPSTASSVATETMTESKEPTEPDVKNVPQMPQQQQQLHTQKPLQKLQPPIPSLFQRQQSSQSSSGSLFKGRWMPKSYCYNYLSWNNCKNGKACAYKHELPSDDVLRKYLPQLTEAIDNCSLKPGELERAMFMLESQEYFQKVIDNDRVEHLFSGSWYTNNMDYCMKLLQIIYQRGHVKPEQIDDIVILWKRLRGQYGIEPLVNTFYIARNLNIQPKEESINTLLQVFSNSEKLNVLWDLMVYCTEIEGFTVPMPCIERALAAAILSPDRDVMSNALSWLKESDLSVLQTINCQLLQHLRYKLLQMNEVEMASSVDYLIRSSRASAQNGLTTGGGLRSETNTPVDSLSRSCSTTPSLPATQNVAVATNVRNGMGEFDHILAEIESVKFSPDWAFLADVYIECSSIKCPIPLFILKRFLKTFTKEDGFQHVAKSWNTFCRHIASSHSQKQAENPALALDKEGLSHMATEIFYACHQKSMWNQACEILQSIQRTSFLVLSQHVAERRGESMVPLAVDAFVQASIPEQAVAVISDYSKKPLNLNVKTRLLTFFNAITGQLCSKANVQAAMNLLQLAFKWNFQDLDIMASTVIGECLQRQIIDLPLQVMDMYIAKTRPFMIDPVVKRCLLNATVHFGHVQYSLQLYEELKKSTSLFQPAKFPNCIVLQPIHTHFEARFVIEDHLNDLYNRLCEKAMAGNQLTRQDLHIKVIINSSSVLTNDRLPYIDLVPMTLLVAQQILTELNLSSEIKTLNKIVVVQPQSLEQYLQNLDVTKRKQGLKFVNRIEPSAGKRR